jgi:hypothetical protein
MKKLLSFLLVIFLVSSSYAQQTKPKQDKIDSEEMNKAMEDAMKQLEVVMDSVDFSQLFTNEMFQLDNLLDSSQMQMLMGGNLNDLFENLFPEGMETEDLEGMMQQGMMMFQNMDMKELESLMEGIDQDELNKMFEGLDFSELEKMFESSQPKKGDDKKSIKRI